MKILNLQSLKGPNYWSNCRTKLIVMKLDLEEYEYLPTNLIPNFCENLTRLIPSLETHRCSYGVALGFIKRMQEGTWLGHVIEHIALELQTLSNMDCGFGRTFSAHEKGVYHVIFSYQIVDAGLYAAKAAVNIAECLAKGGEYSLLEQDLDQLCSIQKQHALGPSTASIIQEAEKRDIPYKKINKSLFILGYGDRQKKIWATVSSQTKNIGVDIVADKNLTKKLLSAHFIPCPKGEVVNDLEELATLLNEIKFPIVIKPHNGNHGNAVTTNINSRDKALLAYSSAKEISQQVIVESFIEGFDYRFLLINFKVVAVAQRTPAKIVGDGEKTIQQLIDDVNQDAKRGVAHENFLTTIKIDKETLEILNEKELTLDSILNKNETLYLKYSANLSAGGTASDVTNIVHPYNIKLAERIARLVDLDICGVDIVAKNIVQPLSADNGAVIEVNAGPGFRMHLEPSQGIARNIGANVIDMLFPKENSWRIPIVAVTGTNGKTTVVRFIARLAKQAKFYTGFTTTEGIYLNDELIYEGDCSGPLSASAILQNPQVNFAILECARGGILRNGLAFDKCDVSIITNITGDHIGLNDIHTLEELVRLKSVVPLSTKKDGYAILNADDNSCYKIKDELTCNVALFAMHKSDRIIQHYQNGGLVAYVDQNYVIVRKGNQEQSVAFLHNIPLTFGGAATCMIKNILPCILTGIIFNFPLEDIKQVLSSFKPSPENTPGRMNIFDFNRFQVMLDYAHNEGAYIELKNYLKQKKYDRKIGIISATGDRREEDTQQIGFYASQIFDDIIIKHNKNGRGRTNKQLTDFLMRGIQKHNPDAKVKVISNEYEAVKYAINHATPGTFIFCSVDDVFEAINYMNSEMSQHYDS